MEKDFFLCLRVMPCASRVTIFKLKVVKYCSATAFVIFQVNAAKSERNHGVVFLLYDSDVQVGWNYYC